MSYFFCKLIPPRLTFVQDMNENERIIMGEHGTYWRKAMDAGKIIAFAPMPNLVFRK